MTHVVSLLAAADPPAHGFSRVIVWAPKATAARFEPRPWLEISTPPELDGPLWSRVRWQAARLPQLAERCSLLFAPGGNAPYQFSPLVLMSQNMLPFEAAERRRYGVSRERLRNEILAFTQRSSFRKADGIIFLTRYAQREVEAAIGREPRARVIPHGIDSPFRIKPRLQRPLEACTLEDPLRILYVSIVDVYKHQWNVVRGVAELRRAGLPVALRLVGPAYRPALNRLQAAMGELDPDHEFIKYDGALPHDELPKAWADADLCVFASSCENGPIILLEAMAAGMPIACSSRGPMPEVLAQGGVYFDPESPPSISTAIRQLASDAGERGRLARRAFERTREMTWQRCAERTFAFLAESAQLGK